jgi:hypothetical protein
MGLHGVAWRCTHRAEMHEDVPQSSAVGSFCQIAVVVNERQLLSTGVNLCQPRRGEHARSCAGMCRIVPRWVRFRRSRFEVTPGSTRLHGVTPCHARVAADVPKCARLCHGRFVFAARVFAGAFGGIAGHSGAFRAAAADGFPAPPALRGRLGASGGIWGHSGASGCVAETRAHDVTPIPPSPRANRRRNV